MMITEFKTQLQSALPPPVKTELDNGPTSSSSLVVSSPPSFAGEKGCQTCHPREYEHWTTTAHARAYVTLVKKDKTSDPSCLACHTTGEGGAQNVKPRVENVQCEACHGLAKGHPDSRRDFEKVDEDDCRKCHNPTNSPHFDYDQYVQRILHPKSPNAGDGNREKGRLARASQ